MNDINLTRGAEKFLCEIYAEYLKRIKRGNSIREAKDFMNKSKWPTQKWDEPDYQELMIELNRAGLIKLYIRGSFILERNAIYIMENRFKDGLKEVLDWISKFI